MDGDEKVEQRGNKKEEFLGIKNLKNGIFVGKKGGQKSTPSPTWRLGLPQTDYVSSPFQDFSFPSNFTPTISARKLAANLWEVVEPNIKSLEMMNKTTAASSSLQQRRNHRNQPSMANNLRKHVLDPPPAMQNQESIARAADAFLHPISPDRGSSSSMEVMIDPYRPPIKTHSRVKGRFRDSGYDLNTSTDLLKVLNRIWSLEEQQGSNISLMKAMQKELDSARVQIKALLQEKKRNRQEMDYLMKQLVETNYDFRRKNKGQEDETIHSLRNELEDERKLRKHSESFHRKLARELSEVKSSFSNALKELDRERKARVLLEDLCDEFAKGIRDYEQEIRILKHKSDKDPSLEEDHTDQLILHISEAWLDERVQMKLAEAGSGSSLQGKKTILDNLSFEIETFLQTKQSGYCGNNSISAVKNLKESSTLQRSSLESFHLNEAGSAPKNGKDEEDSIDSQLYSSKANRDLNISTNQQAETAAASRDFRKTVIPNRTRKRILSRAVNKNSCLPKQPVDDEEPVLEQLSSQVAGIQVDKWTSKEISENPDSSSSLRFHEVDGGGKKENTLKAKLLEARLESRQSHSRN